MNNELPEYVPEKGCMDIVITLGVLTVIAVIIFLLGYVAIRQGLVV